MLHLRRTALAVCLASLGTNEFAAAATITVDQPSDTLNTGCSLRRAITSVNTGVLQAGCNAVGTLGVSDLVQLNVNGAPILLSAGQVPIAKSVIIQGQGRDTSIIDAQQNSRIFDATDATASDTVEIRSVTLRNGSTTGTGAAIRAEDTSLIIQDSVITNNYSGGAGAGIYTDSASDIVIKDSQISANTSNNRGAGVYLGSFGAASRLQLSNSHLHDNLAVSGGAIYALQLTEFAVVDSTFRNNRASSYGGAMTAASCESASIRNSEFTQNSAGSIPLMSSSTYNAYTAAGALQIYQSDSMSIANSRFYDNETAGFGGAINIEKSSRLAITESTLSGNSSASRGGAIHLIEALYATIDDSSFTNNNSSGRGGAVFFDLGTDNVVSDSNFSSNSANSSGGAIGSLSSNYLTLAANQFEQNSSSGYGGAVYAANQTYLNIAGSQVEANTAQNSGGAVSLLNINYATLDRNGLVGNVVTSGSGGGLYLRGTSEVYLLNSTISGNESRLNGGGVAIQTATSSFLRHTTIVNNKAGATGDGADGGGVQVSNSDRFGIFASVVAGNQTTDDGTDVSIKGSTNTQSSDNLFGESSSVLSDSLDGIVLSQSDITAHADGTNPSAMSSLLQPISLLKNRTKAYLPRESSIIRNRVSLAYCGGRDQSGAFWSDSRKCDIGSIAYPDATSFYVIPLSNGKSVVIPL